MHPQSGARARRNNRAVVQHAASRLSGSASRDVCAEADLRLLDEAYLHGRDRSSIGAQTGHGRSCDNQRLDSAVSNDIGRRATVGCERRWHCERAASRHRVARRRCETLRARAAQRERRAAARRVPREYPDRRRASSRSICSCASPTSTASSARCMKTLAEEGESHAAGVWLIDEDEQGCEFWMAHLCSDGVHRAAARLGPT